MLLLAIAALTAAASWMALVHWGLIDRYGADPHDKSQPEALADILLTASAASAGSAGRGDPPSSSVAKLGKETEAAGSVAGRGNAEGRNNVLLRLILIMGSRYMAAIAPLLAMPIFLAFLISGIMKGRATKGSCCNSESSFEGIVSWSVFNSNQPSPLRLEPFLMFLRSLGLATSCCLSHAIAAAWWAAQATGIDRGSLASSVDDMIRMLTETLKVTLSGGASEGDQRILAQALKVVLRLQIPFLLGEDGGGMAESAAAAWRRFRPLLPQKELRLLLPQVVYSIALSALALETALGAIRLAMHLVRSARSPLSHGAIQASDRGGGHSGEQDSEGGRIATQRVGRLVWLLGCCAAPVSLLLGWRGPAAVLCGAVLLTSSTAILTTGAWAGADPWTGGMPYNPAPLGHHVVRLRPQQRGLVGVASPGLWAMIGGMAFFCTGHFCEFSGLQAGSAVQIRVKA